jgi:CBS domain-containing protein
MVKKIHTVDTQATVQDAAQIMAADVQLEGYVVVLERGKPVGIVTERDIVNQVVAHARDSAEMSVSDIMSTPLITIDPDADLLDAAELMRTHGIRKLIVIRGDIVYGIITARSIAFHAGNYVDRSIKDMIRWTTPLGM